MMTYRFDVGKSLRKVQAETRTSNIELAKSFNVSPVQVARWRSAGDLKFSRVVQLAEFFNVSLDDFARLGE